MRVGCLVDTTRCIGCRSCQVACKQSNGLKGEKTKFFSPGGYQNPPRFSARTFTYVSYHELDGPGAGVRDADTLRGLDSLRDVSMLGAVGRMFGPDTRPVHAGLRLAAERACGRIRGVREGEARTRARGPAGAEGRTGLRPATGSRPTATDERS